MYCDCILLRSTVRNAILLKKKQLQLLFITDRRFKFVLILKNIVRVIIYYIITNKPFVRLDYKKKKKNQNIFITTVIALCLGEEVR